VSDPTRCGAVAAAHAILDAIESAGMPMDRSDVAGSAPPLVQAYGEAVAFALSRPGSSSFSDIAGLVGHSERQARRTLRTFTAWLSPLAGQHGWQRQLRKERCSIAAAFLMSPETTIERVARSVGYGSARSLLLAMKSEGIVAPRRWRSSTGNLHVPARATLPQLAASAA